ncbi:unnamed protein product, partial [Mesorhabditis spiculigera]
MTKRRAKKKKEPVIRKTATNTEILKPVVKVVQKPVVVEEQPGPSHRHAPRPTTSQRQPEGAKEKPKSGRSGKRPSRKRQIIILKEVKLRRTPKRPPVTVKRPPAKKPPRLAWSDLLEGDDEEEPGDGQQPSTSQAAQVFSGILYQGDTPPDEEFFTNGYSNEVFGCVRCYDCGTHFNRNVIHIHAPSPDSGDSGMSIAELSENYVKEAVPMKSALKKKPDKDAPEKPKCKKATVFLTPPPEREAAAPAPKSKKSSPAKERHKPSPPSTSAADRELQRATSKIERAKAKYQNYLEAKASAPTGDSPELPTSSPVPQGASPEQLKLTDHIFNPRDPDLPSLEELNRQRLSNETISDRTSPLIDPDDASTPKNGAPKSVDSTARRPIYDENNVGSTPNPTENNSLASDRDRASDDGSEASISRSRTRNQIQQQRVDRGIIERVPEILANLAQQRATEEDDEERERQREAQTNEPMPLAAQQSAERVIVHKRKRDQSSDEEVIDVTSTSPEPVRARQVEMVVEHAPKRSRRRVENSGPSPGPFRTKAEMKQLPPPQKKSVYDLPPIRFDEDDDSRDSNSTMPMYETPYIELQQLDEQAPPPLEQPATKIASDSSSGFASGGLVEDDNDEAMPILFAQTYDDSAQLPRLERPETPPTVGDALNEPMTSTAFQPIIRVPPRHLHLGQAPYIAVPKLQQKPAAATRVRATNRQPAKPKAAPRTITQQLAAQATHQIHQPVAMHHAAPVIQKPSPIHPHQQHQLQQQRALQQVNNGQPFFQAPTVFRTANRMAAPTTQPLHIPMSRPHSVLAQQLSRPSSVMQAQMMERQNPTMTTHAIPSNRPPSVLPHQMVERPGSAMATHLMTVNRPSAVLPHQLPGHRPGSVMGHPYHQHLLPVSRPTSTMMSPQHQHQQTAHNMHQRAPAVSPQSHVQRIRVIGKDGQEFRHDIPPATPRLQNVHAGPMQMVQQPRLQPPVTNMMPISQPVPQQQQPQQQHAPTAIPANHYFYLPDQFGFQPPGMHWPAFTQDFAGPQSGILTAPTARLLQEPVPVRQE